MLRNDAGILKLSLVVSLTLGIFNVDAQTIKVNSINNSSGSEAIGAAILIVILTLLLLYLIFQLSGYLTTIKERKAEKLKTASSPGEIKDRLSGEVNAAIVMALYLYSNELHDQEDPVITMTKVSRTYSPWSSKIYGIRKSPR
jgi:hypothetical protein